MDGIVKRVGPDAGTRPFGDEVRLYVPEQLTTPRRRRICTIRLRLDELTWLVKAADRGFKAMADAVTKDGSLGGGEMTANHAFHSERGKAYSEILDELLAMNAEAPGGLETHKEFTT